MGLAIQDRELGIAALDAAAFQGLLCIDDGLRLLVGDILVVNGGATAVLNLGEIIGIPRSGERNLS